MRQPVNVAVGALTTAFGAIVYWFSRSFSGPSPANDSGLLPRSVGVALMLCGLALLLNGLFARTSRSTDVNTPPTRLTEEGVGSRTTDAPATVETRTSRSIVGSVLNSQLMLPMGALVLSAGFAWAALTRNFLVFTTLYVVGSAWTLERGSRSRWTVMTNILVGICVVASVYFIFTLAFGVRL
jgi:hypothetical protein